MELALESPRRGKIDPGLLSQVLMNLAVNARDAMPRRRRPDDRDRERRPPRLRRRWAAGERAARHVRGERYRHRDGRRDARADLRAVLHDEGAGQRAPGSGSRRCSASSSRAAATCCRIQRAGQRDDVQGVSAACRAPPAAEESRPQPRVRPAAPGPTILLVEDDELVRSPVTLVLEELGYDVCRRAACRSTRGGRPTMLDRPAPHRCRHAGHERPLARRAPARRLRPELKLLFISGYTDDAVIARGVIDREMAFLQKPFGSGNAKLGELLDR